MLEAVCAIAVGAWVFVGVVWFANTLIAGWLIVSDEEEDRGPQ